MSRWGCPKEFSNPAEMIATDGDTASRKDGDVEVFEP
jgi:hypothetical protein